MTHGLSTIAPEPIQAPVSIKIAAFLRDRKLPSLAKLVCVMGSSEQHDAMAEKGPLVDRDRTGCDVKQSVVQVHGLVATNAIQWTKERGSEISGIREPVVIAAHQ